MGRPLSKTRNQCKSYNQRMKKKYYEEQKMDISDVVYHLLENKLQKNEEFEE